MNEAHRPSSKSPFTFGPGEEWIAMAAADAYELLFPGPPVGDRATGDNAGSAAAPSEDCH